MTRGLSRVAGAAITEPISLDEAKLHLRVDVDDDDDLIGSMITSARMSCEDTTQRSIVKQSWLLTMDGFHYRPVEHTHFHGEHHHRGSAWAASHPHPQQRAQIPLPRPPALAVTSVTYRNLLGDVLTLDPSLYRLAIVGDTRAVLLPTGICWPRTEHAPDAVQVAYDAGWSDNAQIPAPLVQWMKLRLTTLYEHRDEYESGGQVTLLGLPTWLIDPYTIPTP